MRWTGLEFKNIQSWEDGYIPLNPDGLTVITAPSETGKSVYIKCLRVALFFKHISADDRKALIRDGYKSGYLCIHLVDGSFVKLIFKPTTFEIELNDGGSISSWREFFPNEVKERLGLVVNADLQLILNLMDQESPMLFDGTSNDYNDEILGFYANHDDLNSRFETLSDWESNISKSLSNKKSTLKYIEDDMNRIPIVENVEVMESDIDRCEVLNASMKYLKKIEVQLVKCQELSPGIPLDISGVTKQFRQLEYLKKLNNLLYDAHNIKNDYVPIDISVETKMLAKLNYLSKMMSKLSAVMQLNAPSESFDITPQFKQLEQLKYLGKLLGALQKCQDIEKVTPLDLHYDYEHEYARLSYIKTVLEKLDNIQSVASLLAKSKLDVEEGKERLDQLRKEFKVCGLCGSILD